jgi:hypothetical protein
LSKSNLKALIQGAKPKLAPLVFCGVDCFIRPWNEKERIELAIHLQTHKGEADGDGDKLTRARAIAMSLCDADGELVFGVEAIDEVAAVRTDLGPPFDAIMAYQGRGDVDADAKKN